MHEKSSAEPSPGLLGQFIDQHGLECPAVVAHRVVHGGADLVQSLRVDDAVEQQIERLEPLAPLHNRHALGWLRLCRERFGPQMPQIAVFDTAFYSGLPGAARNYALPQALMEKYGLRRFGFHGLAHRSMWRQWSALDQDRKGHGRMISLQLGSGCSATAVRDGVAIDTSMGFSPLEGLMMATRCGDVDAGLLTYLQRREGLTPEETDNILEKESGLLGVSGVSGDMRVLLADGRPEADRAVDMFCYRARKYVGAYLAVMGGAECIVFGGGIGEHAWQVRQRILAGMEWSGIRVDAQANRTAQGGQRISSSASAIEVRVCSVDEAGELAREAMAVMTRH